MPKLTRRLIHAAAFFAFILASCGPQPAAVTPTEVPASTTAPVIHAPEIRFAVVGQFTDVNVWALFDEAGASYVNYVTRSEYWPRLYTTSLPDNIFTPLSASGLPSALTQDGELYSATVPLRGDLKWTDGSPFTAEDVVFTVQTALTFELTFDWKAYYNPEYLDHAEAVDSHTVKFFFKQKPNVGVWQYGVLQGPLVQKAYWQENVNAASVLLPDAELNKNISAVQSDIEALKKAIAETYALMPTLKKNSPDYRKAEADLKRNQGNLDAANNRLALLQADYAQRIESAHAKLFSFSAKDEPTLGVWMFGEAQGNVITNEANPAFPFGKPNFDRAVYRFYASEAGAVAALQNNEADLILEAGGLSLDAVKTLSSDTSIKITSSPRSNARFLAFNHARYVFSNPTLRAALECVLDRAALAEKYLQNEAMPLESFVLPQAGIWYNAEAKSRCSGMDDAGRIQTAVSLLKSAGFTWAKEPSADESGAGLLTPEGKPLPVMTLLAPSEAFDSQRADAAKYIEERARLLGIPLKARLVSPDQVLYSVYSSGDYDLAILGWRLSAYPSYACAWFEPWDANPFHYNEAASRSACEAFESAAAIEDARAALSNVQSVFLEELPLIPLYTTLTHDAYRNLAYKFVPLNGLTSLYGAPSLAIPVQ